MPAASIKPIVRDFSPLGENVLVLPDPDPTTAGKLHLPARMFKTGYATGKVIKLGPRIDREHTMTEGVTAFYPVQLGYHKLEYKGAIHLIVPFKNIVGYIP